MLRGPVIFLVLICLAIAGVADEHRPDAPRPLLSAFKAAQAGRWERAAALAARDGPVAADLIEWQRLRAGLGSAGEVLDFLDRNGDWPGLKYLRKQSEEAMASADFDKVLAFYADAPPQSGLGMLNYARALTARGHAGEAEINLVLAWRTMDLTTAEHDAFIKAHGKLLKPHHQARLQMALWRGLKDVQQMLPLVSKDQRELVEIRQMIKNGKPDWQDRLKALPKDLQNDPGVAFEQFSRFVKRDEKTSAIAVILKQSRLENGLGEPERWASWRRALARSMMRDGKAQMAYDLASVHQLVEGANYADLEWLSGYLALKYLGKPKQALTHFRNFSAAVKSPVSKGRAGYWLGRAQEALGDADAARAAYLIGAKYQTSFYGLLAAEKAGVSFDERLSGMEEFPPWRGAGFTKTSIFQAGILALAAGDMYLARRFFTQLAMTLNRPALGQIGQALAELDQPHLQVKVGKTAARRGLVLHAPYYALHPIMREPLPVPMEMALAIARRESEFDFSVVSGAGAQGLMQLMPATAKKVANDLELEHESARVLRDWRYNARLGSAYLAQLAEQFEGNILLVAAGYNAGPNRSLRWIEGYGDPRKARTDAVDWIEHIPFRETRNYVMRVAESLPVYRARLGKNPLPIPFSQELSGSSVRVLAE
ncbi:Soluble lytic murein transglycosylase precursor [hydrothermal vent metagenome]|uniref:Soluble lytic murein transglycosylase n=1 Tax=hydrothermal vent metagenome TaxID=652676 RepID=A0A3B0S6U1_9ZZZZ